VSAARGAATLRNPLSWVLGVVGIVVVGAVLVVTGVIRPLGSDVARPPCDQLPSTAEVASALDTHTDLTGRIEGAGDGVRVASNSVCGQDADRALVQVRYRSGAERSAIEAVLNDSSGYGVPVELVKD